MKINRSLKKNIRSLGLEKLAVEFDKELKKEIDKATWSFPIVEEKNTKTIEVMSVELCKAMEVLEPLPKICIRLSRIVPKGSVLKQDCKGLIKHCAKCYLDPSVVYGKEVLEYDEIYNVNKEEFLEVMDKMEKPEAGLGFSVSGRVFPDYKGIPVIE